MRLYYEEISERTLLVTLKSSGNSFGVECSRELQALTKKLAKSKITSLIFTGHDRFFCTGGDVKLYQSLKTKAEGIRINREIAKTLEAFSKLAVYKIAWVNGDCFGGGVELLSCFDSVVMRPEAFVGLWQSRQSLSFGWGGWARLSNKVAPSLLRTMLMQGQTLSAYEARRIGLVDRVCSANEIRDACLTLARDSRNSKAQLSDFRKLNSKNEQQIFAGMWRKKAPGSFTS